MRLEQLPERYRVQAMQQLARTSRIGRIQEQGKPVEEPENPDGGKKMAVKDESPKLQPGTRFGRLVVVEAAKTVQKVKMSLCKCDCGSIVSVRNCHLLSGHTRSCGCLAREAKPKNPNKMSGTPLYKVWDGMKYRCYSPNAPQYHNYGSRGITMCDEWHKSYRAFRDWAISNGYQPGLSLDRIDNDGNYEPSNCRWTDSVAQGGTGGRISSLNTKAKKRRSRSGLNIRDFTIRRFSCATAKGGLRKKSSKRPRESMPEEARKGNAIS